MQLKEKYCQYTVVFELVGRLERDKNYTMEVDFPETAWRVLLDPALKSMLILLEGAVALVSWALSQMPLLCRVMNHRFHMFDHVRITHLTSRPFASSSQMKEAKNRH